MNYALVILGAPCSSQANQTAFRFARAALAAGHQIYRIFFYQDGVYCSSGLAAANDETNLVAHWQALQSQYNLDLVVCVGAGMRRGLFSQGAGDAGSKVATDNLAAGFEVSGLGQLIDASLQVDRLITFGV